MSNVHAWRGLGAQSWNPNAQTGGHKRGWRWRGSYVLIGANGGAHRINRNIASSMYAWKG